MAMRSGLFDGGQSRGYRGRRWRGSRTNLLAAGSIRNPGMMEFCWCLRGCRSAVRSQLVKTQWLQDCLIHYGHERLQ